MLHAQFELAAEGRLQIRGEQRGRDAFSRDVGQQHAQAAGAEVEKIVVIAADFARRQASSAVGDGFERLRVLREQALLDMPRDFELAAGFLTLLRAVGLFLDGGEQARVVPRLLNEVDRAAPHRLDREIDAGPRGHHDHRHAAVARQQMIEQRQAFVARGGVARIIHVHQDQIERVAFHGGEGGARRIRGFGLMARAF